MLDQRTRQDQLIEALYDLALNPNNFDSFTEAWEQYLQDNQLNSDKELDVPDCLARHFSRAFKILEKFGREVAVDDNQALDAFLETRHLPSIAIETNGKLLALNSRAKTLFKPDQPLSVLQDLVHENSKEPLLEGLSKVSLNVPYSLVILMPNSQPTLMLMQRISDSNRIVVDVAGSTWGARMHRTLKSMYSLTETEFSVAAMLYQGLTINEIAKRENRALDTVRQHTKSLLKKTQTHSQPRLMKLLTSYNFAQKNSGDQTKWANSKCANYVHRLNDGRNYAYYDTGGNGSKAIVVLHGILHDPELPDLMHDALVADGYRIIGPSRAWFGESSPPLSRDSLLQNSASDLIELLDYLKLESVVLLGNMAGAAHAYTTTALYPARVKQIINIAGVVPLINEDQIKAMPKSVRAVVRTARYFPKLLPTLMRTALALIDNGDIRKLFETNYRSSPIDIAATKQEDVYQRLYTGYRFAAHSGYEAYTYEGLALTQDLSSYLEKVTCRCCLIHGVHDDITSINSVIDFAHTQDQVHVTSIEQAGNLIMYTEPQLATKALMERLSLSV